MMAPQLHECFAQNPDTPARSIDGEAIVITPHDSVLHNLNETATFIWERADGRRSLQDIVAEFCEAYDVEPSVIARDALTFVMDAVRRGLMIRTSAGQVA